MYGEINYYGFDPSMVLACISFSLYFLGSCSYLGQNIYYKSHYTYFIFLAGYFESIGYALRIYTVKHTDHLNIVIASKIFILIPKSVFIFGWYIVLSQVIIRMKLFNPPSLNWYKVYLLTSSFFLAFGTVKTTKNSDSHIGKLFFNIGLTIMLSNYVVNTLLCIYVYYKSLKYSDNYNQRWRYLFYPLFISVFALLFRGIYRLVCFEIDYRGEDAFYPLESLMTIIVLLAWNVFHPSRFSTTIDEQQENEKSSTTNMA